MKPDSISQDAKEVILSNITLYKFGYSSPSTLDDFFQKFQLYLEGLVYTQMT